MATMTLESFMPGEVLDRAGDAERHVKVGRHHLAGLAHLPVVGGEPCIHRRAGGAHGGVELVGQALHDLEALLGADAAPARDDDARRGELGPLGGRDAVLDQAERPGSWGAGTSSWGAEPPVAAGSKPEVRTVSTLTGSAERTVCTALPA
jgi:hypothetical protein